MKTIAKVLFVVFTVALLTIGASAETQTSSPEQMIEAIRSAVHAKPGLVAEAATKKDHIKVEIITAALQEYKLKLDPLTFEVLDIESKGPVKAHKVEAYSSETLIEALKLAVARHPGTIEEVEVERENGRLYVEVEIHCQEHGKRDYYVDMRNRTVTLEK